MRKIILLVTFRCRFLGYVINNIVIQKNVGDETKNKVLRFYSQQKSSIKINLSTHPRQENSSDLGQS